MISTGTIESRLVIPYPDNSVARLGLIITGLGSARKLAPTNPPIRTPVTKNKFHASFFHSYLKKGIFDGKQAAQICLRADDIPKALLPNINRTGTIRPISGPATYHGHGFFNTSNIVEIQLRNYVHHHLPNSAKPEDSWKFLSSPFTSLPYFNTLLWHIKSVFERLVLEMALNPPSTSVKFL